MSYNNLIESGNCINAKGHFIPGRSGLLTGLAANALVAAVRNTGPQELIVDSIEQTWFTTTPGSTFGPLAFAAYVVEGFTVLANTGARATEPLPIRKRVADHQRLFVDQAQLDAASLSGSRQGFAPADTFVQVEVADTGALSGSTFTAPAFDDPLAQLIARNAVITATALTYDGHSKWEPRNGIPITLGANMGLVFVTQAAFPTALVGRYSIGVDVRIQ